MIIAKIAAYMVSIVAILVLSVKFLWLFFLLFMYRTYSSIISFEWFQSIGLDNHLVYFIFISVLSLVSYLVLLRSTIYLPWIRYIILGLLMIWVFINYSFADIFFFKDYLESKGMWGLDWYKNQLKEIFTTDFSGFQDLFTSAFDDVFDSFKSILSGITSKSDTTP